MKWLKRGLMILLVPLLGGMVGCTTTIPSIDPSVLTNLPPGSVTNIPPWVVTNLPPWVVTNLPPPVVVTNAPTPVVTNVPGPVVTNTPVPVASGRVLGVMFMQQKIPKAPWITVSAKHYISGFRLGMYRFGLHRLIGDNGSLWPDSTQAYARSHGTSWENDYRQWIVKAVSGWGGNAVVYFADRLSGAIELEMFLCDTASPVDGHHINNAENSAVWLRNAGITTDIIVLTDSPPPWNTPGGSMDKYIADIAKAYASARNRKHYWNIGLECDRNPLTSVQGCQNIAAIIRKYEPNAQIIVGSQSLDFLNQIVDADGTLMPWKEQDGHPIFNSLTQATAVNYANQLESLAQRVSKKLGISIEAARLRVWAGEWYAQTPTDRIAISKMLFDRGFQFGCYQGKALVQSTGK